MKRPNFGTVYRVEPIDRTWICVVLFGRSFDTAWQLSGDLVRMFWRFQ